MKNSKFEHGNLPNESSDQEKHIGLWVEVGWEFHRKYGYNLRASENDWFL